MLVFMARNYGWRSVRFMSQYARSLNMALTVSPKSKRERPKKDPPGAAMPEASPASRPPPAATKGMTSRPPELMQSRPERVDQWFDQQLTDLYGEVAEEPIPQEMLSLINRLKDRN